jgi:hypothetical protein
MKIAQEKAHQWAGHWFEPHELSVWLPEWPNAVPSVAVGSRDEGVEPATAMVPLWYGKVRPNQRRRLLWRPERQGSDQPAPCGRHGRVTVGAHSGQRSSSVSRRQERRGPRCRGSDPSTTSSTRPPSDPDPIA